jgi:hypothetical protein
MINITFIGSCQTVGLCFFFQQLLKNKKNDYYVSWVLYSEVFKQHLHEWSNKCENKILNYQQSMQQIKKSDVIIYQHINESKCNFSNPNFLNQVKKESCILIQISCIHFDYSYFEKSLVELKKREIQKGVDIKVSKFIESNPKYKMMLSIYHPNTFLFLEIMKEILLILNMDFFSKEEYHYYCKNEDFMNLGRL